ncbi:MAG: nucleotidyltransferase [Lachnospiraceae bacterium]|nr:nucleotidyltransferase [Lachnospiraceae bacterium]
MKVNGIIAEYNPFHNGHKYHLEASRLRTGADFTIVAMSGDFMQRGTPAILNKYARAEMALKGGADLVLEIPAFFACGSAEYFAHGAVSLLDKLGVVDFLCFGSECGEIESLKQIAGILAEEPEGFKKHLTAKLSQGYSFPTARSLAMLDFSPSLGDINNVFTSPNNILGIEYIKALIRRQSSIRPFTIKRVGSQYHEKRLGYAQPSALALRHAIFSHGNLDTLQEQMPDSTFEILKNTWEYSHPMQTDDLSAPLLYKLITEESAGFAHYLDVTPDLSDKIRKTLYQFTGFDSFCDLLKSKDLTHTRISRCLLHILLNITNEDMTGYKDLDYAPYARVLALKKDATPLLSAIKANSSIPLVTKLADADKLLEAPAFDMLTKDIRISHLYNAIEANKCNAPIRNEYSTPIIVL